MQNTGLSGTRESNTNTNLEKLFCDGSFWLPEAEAALTQVDE